MPTRSSRCCGRHGRRRGRGARRPRRVAPGRRPRPRRPVHARPDRGWRGAARCSAGAGLTVLSEESGHHAGRAPDHGRDGSGRRLDQRGAWAAVVGDEPVRGRRASAHGWRSSPIRPRGTRWSAVRGQGARRDGVPFTRPATPALAGLDHRLRRAAAVPLRLVAVPSAGCDGARPVRGRRRSARRLPAVRRRGRARVGLPRRHLICREAGAAIVDLHGRDLVALDHDARRIPCAAGDDALLDDPARGAPAVRIARAARTARTLRPVLEGLHRRSLRLLRRVPNPLLERAVRLRSPSYTLGTACMIEHEGKVLLVQHGLPAHWSLPGGLLDKRRDAGRGLRREVREEVGIEVVRRAAIPSSIVDLGSQLVDFFFRASLARRCRSRRRARRSSEIEQVSGSRATRPGNWCTGRRACARSSRCSTTCPPGLVVLEARPPRQTVVVTPPSTAIA